MKVPLNVSRQTALTVCLLLFSIILHAQTVTTLTGFPTDEPGYELGVSACFAGVVDDEVIIAGGCNFPEPGKKRYYSGIYAARVTDSGPLRWRLVGRLPEPAAYGGTVQVGDTLLLIGGNNADHSLSRVVALVRSVGEGTQRSADNHSQASVFTLHSMPSLPCTADNLGATVCEGVVYVFGGNQDGKASSNLFALDLSHPNGWQRLPSAPGAPRVQPVVVAAQPSCANHCKTPSVYVWGGFYSNGRHSHVATDGLCYHVKKGKWTRLSAPRDTLGRKLTLSGATAVATCQEEGSKEKTGRPVIVAVGGVNKDIFRDAISGSYRLVQEKDYLKQPVSWYRFSGNLLQFDVDKGRWLPTTFADERLARAGAQLVQVSPQTLWCIGGEVKPSVRTPLTAKIVFK